MIDSITRLKNGVEEWLIRNELDTDTFFYSNPEWLTREEEYLNDAELILVFEGNLHTMINYGGDTSEFDDYIESFGYYHEQGHSWNLGFYPIPDYDHSSPIGTYRAQLQDHRWKKKANLVKERAGHKCQDCGLGKPLEAHHCYYTGMRLENRAWEYPLSALRALCRECHEERAKSEIRMRAYLSQFTKQQIDSLRSNLDYANSWFETDPLLRFMSKLNHDEAASQEALRTLFLNKKD